VPRLFELGADPDVTRLPYTKRKTPFWPKVADPWVNK